MPENSGVEHVAKFSVLYGIMWSSSDEMQNAFLRPQKIN